MNTREAKKSLKKILTTDHLPIFLHGMPGIGKSEIFKQIAEELEWEFIDIRLTMMQPSDLMGLPYPDKEHTKANWLYPSIFPPPDSKKNYLILFDELSNAPMTIQNAAYRLVLDRSLGEHYSLPDGARIVAAGNRVTDGSGVQRLSKALSNRFIHFNLEPDYQAWKDWALKNNINEKVIDFLRFKTNLLAVDPKKVKIEEHAYPTPRSWTFVSRLFNFGMEDEEIIRGAIGEGTAAEFLTYIKIFDRLPNIDKILSGKHKVVPKDPDVLYALSSSLVLRANVKNIENLFKYTEKMPMEFHVLTIRDIARRDDKILESYSKFDKWLAKNAKFFEDDDDD